MANYAGSWRHAGKCVFSYLGSWIPFARLISLVQLIGLTLRVLQRLICSTTDRSYLGVGD